MSQAAALKEALCSFCGEIYDKILQEHGGSTNVFLSPVSIYTAFVMTMAGAAGNTEQEMLRVLQIPKELTSGVHESFGENLMTYFRPTEGVDISVANRIFLLKEAQLVDAFKNTLQKSYKAELEKLSALPDLDSMRKHINKWVEQATKDKIKDLIPFGGLPGATTLVLTNALYFRGFWKDEFEKASTHDADFHCLDGSKMKVRMMYKEETYKYLELPEYNATAVKIPFKSTNWEMLLVVPNENNGLETVSKKLRQKGKLSELLKAEFFEEKIELLLPRFKLDMKDPINLKNALTACGMKSLFNDTADLSKMCVHPRLYIDSAFHKAVLEVDETGATAAAATGMVAVAMCYIPKPRVAADKPFFVAILCDQTIPLFIGHVVKPENL